MIKNFLCVLLASVCLYISVYSLNFKVSGATYTFCSEFASDSPFEICKYANAEKIKLSGRYKAETVCFENSDKVVLDILLQYNAKPVKKESLANVENVYYYSAKIPFYQLIDGFMVNIQVATDGNKTYIGTPIIYGGY